MKLKFWSYKARSPFLWLLAFVLILYINFWGINILIIYSLYLLIAITLSSIIKLFSPTKDDYV